MDTGVHYFFTLPLWVSPSGVFRVRLCASCSHSHSSPSCLMSKAWSRRVSVQDYIQPFLQRRKTSTSQRFTIPVLLGDHGRCDILPRWDPASSFSCSTAYELSHHFRSWDCGTVAVWESWSGGRLGIKGRKRERAETQG